MSLRFDLGRESFRAKRWCRSRRLEDGEAKLAASYFVRGFRRIQRPVALPADSTASNACDRSYYKSCSRLVRNAAVGRIGKKMILAPLARAAGMENEPGCSLQKRVMSRIAGLPGGVASQVVPAFVKPRFRTGIKLVEREGPGHTKDTSFNLGKEVPQNVLDFPSSINMFVSHQHFIIQVISTSKRHRGRAFPAETPEYCSFARDTRSELSSVG